MHGLAVMGGVVFGYMVHIHWVAWGLVYLLALLALWVLSLPPVGIDAKALSDTSVLLAPGSHKMKLNPRGTKYYEVSQVERAAMIQKGFIPKHIAVASGGAVFLKGGKTVHGVPGVRDDEPARFTTYTRFLIRS